MHVAFKLSRSKRDMRVSFNLSRSKLKAYLSSRPSRDGTVGLFELVALAESRPPGFYNTVELLDRYLELSDLEEFIAEHEANVPPDGDTTIEFTLPAPCYVSPLEERETLESNLAFFLGQLTITGDRKRFYEFMRREKADLDEAGIRALLKLLHHSVAKDPDYDDRTRGMLLSFLEDRLPAKLMVKLPRGPMPRVPEIAIKHVMKEWLTGGGGMESAYARVKEELGVTRTVAQRVAKKYKLRPATKTE